MILHALAALLLLVPAHARPPAPGKRPPAKAERKSPSVDALIEGLQTSWDAAKTYQAKFQQVVTSKRLGTRDETRGTLFVVKPSHLRWESETDGGFQIMSEKKLTVVHKNRRGTVVVDLYPDLGKVMDPRPLAFLSGRVKFKDLYTIDLVSETPDAATVRFVTRGTPNDALVAEIDKKSYFLRSLTSETLESTVRTEFTGVRTNIELGEALFEYKPGSGDIIHRN